LQQKKLELIEALANADEEIAEFYLDERTPSAALIQVNCTNCWLRLGDAP
jgi:CRISPR/Cas system-associated exonuclease Cas4 (RecB family)